MKCHPVGGDHKYGTLFCFLKIAPVHLFKKLESPEEEEEKKRLKVDFSEVVLSLLAC